MLGQLQGRQSNQRQLEESDEDDSETTDNSSLDSDDVADYLANVEPHSADSNSGQEQVCCASHQCQRFTRSGLNGAQPVGAQGICLQAAGMLLQGHFLLANFDNHPVAEAVQAAEEGQFPGYNPSDAS